MNKTFMPRIVASLSLPVVVLAFVMLAMAAISPISLSTWYWQRPTLPYALACTMFSLLLAGAASLTFLRAGTTLNPQQPQKVTTLVTAGVFSLSRNPIYLAQLLFLVAWSLLLTGGLMCWSGCLLYFVYLQRWQIPREEVLLHQRFGQEYAAYCKKVRRWI